MIKWAIYRLHWLLGITAGVVLSVMGVTGATMAFEDEIMTAWSHGIVDVPVRTGAPVLAPDELLARFIEQSPESIPVKLTLFPEPGKSARLVYRPRSADTEEDNTDGTWLNPYTGEVLGKAGGVLALGHRDYPDFCGFGRMLESWLRGSGVELLFPVIEMHADDPAALASWRQQLRALGAAAQPDASWQVEATQPWRLLERTLLNPESTAAEAYHLVLEPQQAASAAATADWTAGDIAVITPHRMGNRAAQDARAPTRQYSISSIPTRGKLELMVRKTVLADGQLGLGSGWLTHYAAPGDIVHLRIRSNPGFHPPRRHGPMILIGAGTGLAGLRAHLLHRQHNGLKGAWLVFGERSSRTDRPHRGQIESWMGDGTLSRCDLVFSRDSTCRQYVQHRLEEAASQVLSWVRQDRATIFVCGGLKMGQAVHAVLQKILGESHLEEMAAAGHYRRDVY